MQINFEIKTIGPREFEGYGSVFGNVDLGGDIVVPGAFKDSLERHKSEGTMPLMYWMHQSDQVPGVWTDMSEDSNGLYVKGELVDTALGRDVRTLLSKKAVRGLSIGYSTVDSDRDNRGRRRLKQLDLYEVSIVSMAMNPLAKVEAMKARLSADGEYVPSQREIEHWLREKGCSRSVARLMTARLFDGDNGALWDADDSTSGTLGNVGGEEEKAALQAIRSLTDRIGVQALRLPLI